MSNHTHGLWSDIHTVFCVYAGMWFVAFNLAFLCVSLLWHKKHSSNGANQQKAIIFFFGFEWFVPNGTICLHWIDFKHFDFIEAVWHFIWIAMFLSLELIDFVFSSAENLIVWSGDEDGKFSHFFMFFDFFLKSKPRRKNNNFYYLLPAREPYSQENALCWERNYGHWRRAGKSILVLFSYFNILWILNCVNFSLIALTRNSYSIACGFWLTTIKSHGMPNWWIVNDWQIGYVPKF